MRYNFVIILLICACTFCFGQKSYRFETITVDDGLSQSGVLCMVQDKLGYLWIGTQDGLNRYDGYSFKVFRNKEGDSTSLPKNFISNVFLDHEENLWVATFGYLSKYNAATGGFKNYRIKENVSPNTNPVSIFLCRDHSFAITYGEELIFFNPQNEKVFHREESRHLKKVLAYIETAYDGDWMFGEKTLHRKKPESNWNEVEVKGLPYYYESTGTLLIDKGFELQKFNRETNSWKKFTNHGGRNLILSDGSIWVDGYTRISVFSSQAVLQQEIPVQQIVPGSPSTFTNCLYQTRDGVIWIGTNGYGLKKYNAQTNLFGYIGAAPSEAVRLSHAYVDAIYTRNDTIIYVSTPAGLDIINLIDNTSRNIPFPTRIMRMTMDKRGTFWFTAWNGLYILKNDQFVNVSKWADFLDTDLQPGYVDIEWTKHVIRKVGPAYNDLFYDRLLIGDSIWMHVSGLQAKTVYIDVTIAGVTNSKIIQDFKYAPNNPTTAPLSVSIKLIQQDSRKNIWIGSNSEGLCLFNPKQKNFTHFTEKDGLPNNVVYGILEDNNQNLWLSTNKGLCEFNPVTKEVRNFDVYDGLQSNEFNTGAFFKSPSGKMYFGGVNGVTYFHPKDIITNNAIPQSAISGFYVNNNLLNDYSEYVQQDPETKQQILTLQYNQRDFGFDVVGIGFSLPGRTHYRYMLENYDAQWHDIGNLRHVSFTNIPPGQYVFKVQSSDSYGNWESTGASVLVAIQSPLWRNFWVWIGGGLSLFALILLAYWFRIRQLKKQTGLLERIVDERTQKIQLQKDQIENQNEELQAQASYLEEKNVELEKAKGLLEIEVKYLHQHQLLRSSIHTQEEERKRIAQDLHDELGAVLSISRMHLVQIQNQNASPESIQTGLQQAKMLTETALATMRRISHDLMPPQLEMFGLVKTLETITNQIQDTKKIAVHFHASDDIGRWSLPIELGLYRICMEMVNNTIKHAEATRIDINLRQLADHISFSYSDNGKGLPKVINAGHGLKNIEARVNSMGGEVEIGNRDSGGFYATVKIFSKGQLTLNVLKTIVDTHAGKD